MTNTMKPSNDALRCLLHKINDYESGLYHIIKSLVFYQMKDFGRITRRGATLVNQRIYSDNQIWTY